MIAAYIEFERKNYKERNKLFTMWWKFFSTQKLHVF